MSAPVVPLFPLPSVLLYSGAVLPLHVFEPRYVSLVEDLQSTGQDRLALALLKPGWKDQYFETPPFYELGGIGRIVSVQNAPSGRYNILVEGEDRARLAEVPSEHAYRMVRAEALPAPPVEEDTHLRHALIEALSACSEETVHVDAERGTSYLADLLLLTLGVSIEEKQNIFEVLDPQLRAQRVLAHFDRAQALSQRLDQARDRADDGAVDWN